MTFQLRKVAVGRLCPTGESPTLVGCQAVQIRRQIHGVTFARRELFVNPGLSI